ncbi:arrestin domain-containing protein 3-like [Lampris incognitus]|uniref:arrestin domain-containing protein 3-like n=1 Tax=Lampris incognitus TaxID=2546036 RepID=UPI0024B5327D|nr:arrestin domain-containing protein 3-like [Lampris incognitus]
MPSIKQLTLCLDYLNEEKTFSEGDTITGSVTLDLEKESKIEKFFVKAKGDANVHWSEKRGDRNHSYNAHDRLFKVKQFFIPETSKDTVLPRGRHQYKFSLQIPMGNMPSSFRGAYGKIVYKLVATLSRSWKLNREDEKELNFVSKSISDIGSLMSRQVRSTNKEMGLFSSGTVHMDVTVDKTAYAPGETIALAVKVKNSSSKDMTPKFILKKKVVYRASGSKKYHEDVVCRMVGDLIKSGEEETINCGMKIAADQGLTVHNSGIISVEYQLKVYLDISFASDPEVRFPLVIVPASLTSGLYPSGPVGPYPQGAFGGPHHGYPAAPGPGKSDFPEYPAPPNMYPANPGVYAGQPTVYPAPPLPIGGGYSNPLPQHPSPYGSPFSSSSSTPVHHNPPTVPIAPMLDPTPSAPSMFQPSPSAPSMFQPSPSAPPLFQPPPSAPPMFDLPPSMQMMNTNFLSQQDEQPPSYMSLFPPSVSETSSAVSDAKNK